MPLTKPPARWTTTSPNLQGSSEKTTEWLARLGEVPELGKRKDAGGMAIRLKDEVDPITAH